MEEEKEYRVTAVSYSSILVMAKNENEARQIAHGECECFVFDTYDIADVEEVKAKPLLVPNVHGNEILRLWKK